MKIYVSASITDGCVGIWWITDNYYMIGISKPTENSYDDGSGWLQYDDHTNHLNYWKEAINQLPDSYNKQEIYNLGYKGLERGRVIFNLRTQCYELTCSEKISKDEKAIKAIKKFFDIENKRCDIEILNHYAKLPLTGNPAYDDFIENGDY